MISFALSRRMFLSRMAEPVNGSSSSMTNITSMNGGQMTTTMSTSNFELDSASEWSDTSSLDGSMSGATTPILHRTFPPPAAPDHGSGLQVTLGPAAGMMSSSREQTQRLIERLQQENRVLKMELDTQKHRIKALQDENKSLRQQSVMIVSLSSAFFSQIVFTSHFGKLVHLIF